MTHYEKNRKIHEKKSQYKTYLKDIKSCYMTLVIIISVLIICQILMSKRILIRDYNL